MSRCRAPKYLISQWSPIFVIFPKCSRMANTYVQAYFHIVFAVNNRQALIQKKWKDELEKYISTIVQNHGHKLIAIGSMPDHIHINHGQIFILWPLNFLTHFRFSWKRKTNGQNNNLPSERVGHPFWMSIFFDFIQRLD